MLAGQFRLRMQEPLLLLLVVIPSFLMACASGEAALGEVTVSFPGDLPAAENAVIGAAPACGLQLTRALRDEAQGSAILVFLDEWQNPAPESALVTVRLEPAKVGVSCRIEAHPLAEYGMVPPDVAGGGASACKPCSQARSDFPFVRYSRGQAMGNVARTSRCLGSAIGSEVPSGN